LRPHPRPAATIRTWSTSSASTLILALLLLLVSTDAGAGRRPKDTVEPEPTPAPAPRPKTRPIELFDAPLPLPIGGLPAGLANVTAMGCAACHVDAHTGWTGSAHAIGWRSAAFVDAVAQAGTPACTACHVPLIEQAPQLVSYDGASPNQPVFAPNPSFNASLYLEGVTCAACHVRGGQVIAARPPEEVGKAPHPLAWSEDLSTSEGCATCHQLTWPGADAPFYDTFGEWQRSAYAKAGVRCQDCHGAIAQGFDHATPRGAERAVSALIDVDGLELSATDPLKFAITLQNTGAGHAFPTGSPFVGVELRAWLEGPPDKKGKPTVTAPFAARLERKLGDAAPWPTLEDTRLPAGGTRTFDVTLTLPDDPAAGPWTMHVVLAEVVRGQLTDRILLERSLPMSLR
jgi:hypothetical protein